MQSKDTPNSNDLTLIKVGTGVLTQVENGTIDRASVVNLTSAIAKLMSDGHRCLYVSSGAVGAGVTAMNLTEYPEDIETRQACAAIGQAKLLEIYADLFENYDITIAQLLLTAENLTTPRRASYIHNTLTRLLQESNVLPVINENDSVAVEELNFGDNDMLAVQVAKLIGARRVILLTSVDGLLNPETQELLTEVSDIDGVFKHVRSDRGKFSMGGMASKLKAVKFAVESGIEVHIANGRVPERLSDIFAGHGVSTKFLPHSIS